MRPWRAVVLIFSRVVAAGIGPLVPSVGPVVVTATAGNTGPTDYPNLGAAFTAINGGTHQGNITIDITGNTSEAAMAVLNNSGAGGASYMSVLIRPSGGPRTISGNVFAAVIKLNGADNVTIDGRIGGTGRNLSITNANNGPIGAIWLASVTAGDGCTNNIIRNVEIACQHSVNNGQVGIYVGGQNFGQLHDNGGNDNDNNSLIANRIIRCSYGIATQGTDTNYNVGTVITDNIIGPASFGSDAIGRMGIYMANDTGALIARNTIQFVGGDFANTIFAVPRIGIGIGSDLWGISVQREPGENYTITGNIIHDVVDERGGSAVGILLAANNNGAPTSNLVANNFIYNVRANSAFNLQFAGVAIATGHTDKVLFNSIRITGDVDPGGVASCATFGAGVSIIDRSGNGIPQPVNLTLADNNIYVDVNSNSPAVHFYAVVAPSTDSFSFGSGFENYNNYYVNQANPQMFTGGRANSFAPAATTEFPSLADWRTAFSPPQDDNSIQADPLFVSATDLHINSGSPANGAGTPIGSITTDIDGEPRNPTTPDIGADEIAGGGITPTPSPTGTPSATPSPTSTPPCIPRIVYASTRTIRNYEIDAMNLDGSNQTPLTEGSDNREPSASSDGSKIAFVSHRDGNTYQIYVMNADGSNQTRLTTPPGNNLEPSFSSDGSKIAFVSDRDSFPHIYVMNADGSNQTRLTNTNGFDFEPSFSPDGSKIVFESYRDGSNYQVYVMNAVGSNQTRLTNPPGFNGDPSFSPDGSKIAFVSTRDLPNLTQIYVMNADGSGQTRLTNPPEFDRYPAYSADGSRIVFTSTRDNNFEICVMNADGSGQTRLTANRYFDTTPSFAGCVAATPTPIPTATPTPRATPRPRPTRRPRP